MTKKEKMGFVKRVYSIVLALALVITSVQISVPVKDVKAASSEGISDKENLSATHVPDSEVRKLYTILANAQKNLEVATKKEDADDIAAAKTVLNELAGMNAGQIVTKYGSNATYTQSVYVIYLTNYPGKIDFTGLTVSNIEGIGWARAAAEFNLSTITSIKEIPAYEFAYCSMTKIVLPSGVTKIGDNAFNSCGKLVTLNIGTSSEGVVDLRKVKEIGASAFSGCASIKEVDFAEYTTSANELKIGSSAFASCTSIEEIEVPIKTAANLGANAFEQCTKLTKVGLHDALTYLNSGLFMGAGAAEYKVKFYVIEDGESANNVSHLPGNITYIGNGCFQNAYLGNMDLSDCTKLKKINQYAFSTAYISEIVFPESLEIIEIMAFNAASIWEALVIPEKCTTIGEGAFSRSTLSEITLPASLKVIADKTFEACAYLDGNLIHIPANSQLESIGAAAFKDCEYLETTSFLKDLKNLKTIGDSAFAHCFVYLTNASGSVQNNIYGERSVIAGLEEIILPDSVISLGESVFADNYYLQSVDLGEGITMIPDKAFYNSNVSGRLETVTVSSKLETIGVSAFQNQTRLHTIGYGNTIKEGTVQFGSKLYSIGDKAFSNCGVKSVANIYGMKVYVLAENVSETKATGKTEFLIYDYENEASTAESQYCRTVYVDEEDFYNTNDLNTLEKETGVEILDNSNKLVNSKYVELYIVAKKAYVDFSKLSTYKANTSDTEFSVYEMYETDTDAYEGRFYSQNTTLEQKYYCTEDDLANIASISSGSGKTAVYIKAVSSSKIANVAITKGASQTIRISYMFGMKDVKIPDSVMQDNLGANAFEKCVNLNKVTLSENLTEIKDNTFSGAGGEVENAINSGNKYYDYYGLRTVYIPDGMKVIGKNAFMNCSNLYFADTSSSALGTSLESIGDYAFSGCYSLETMKFPTSLKTIGASAFAQCAAKPSNQYENPEYYYEIVDYSTATPVKYPYYWNYDVYGTKTEKTGLTVIDFTTAKNLEEIGSSAFKQTNVKSVQLTNSPLKVISSNMFEQCSYLEYVTFPENITEVKANALKDTVGLITVTMPVTAVVANNFISGAYGSVTVDRETRLEKADPVLTFSYKENDEVVVPVNSSVRLPFNAFNASVCNGEIEVVVVDGDDEINILDREVNGLKAEVDRSKSPYSFILHGAKYLKEPVTLKVKVGTAFKYANFDAYWVNNHSFTYQVTIDDVPTESVVLSAETDNFVKNNPAMYKDNGNKKTLYVEEGSAASKGIKLTATINPVETTDKVTWTSSDSSVVEVVPDEYTGGTGEAKATIKVKKIGDATVTVQSGKKTDVIYVTGQIGAVSASGLTCTTEGTILDETLKTNSSSSPYDIAVGDSDKINVSVNYGNTNYTEDQLNTYGEQVVITSSDENVIVVEDDGTFRAVGEGTASITVIGQASGKRVTFYVRVTDETNYTPSSVTISGPASVNVGKTISLTAAVAPSRASQEVTWAVTSGTQYVSVDQKGRVTGLAKGSAIIVATSVAKNTVRSMAYTVKVNVPVEAINILQQDISIEVGRTLNLGKTTDKNATLGFYVHPLDATESITWKSSNEKIVKISGGSSSSVQLEGVAIGVATVTATAESGVSVSFKVSIIQKTESITVDKEVTLNVGKTHTLKPQKVPATSNENLTYTYKSSNENVAKVNANGVITAVGPGTAQITVSTNTNRSTYCMVTVKQPAKKITLLLNRPSTKKIYLVKGQMVTLNSKLSPDNSTDTLTYKSSKKKIAAVSASGTITAKKKGTATITVKASSGKKVTLKVYVCKKAVAAKKVKIKLKKTMKRKKTVKVGVTLNPTKSTDTLSFAVNNPSRATIDAFGNLTALKKGKVKVTVTASSGKSATKTIKIK